MKKIKVYIDGYNLYHSLNEQFNHKWYYRIDYKVLLQHYIQPDETIIWIDYYTAYCERDIRKVKRHQKLITLLQSQWVRVILWKYTTKVSRYTDKKKTTKVDYSQYVKKHIDVQHHQQTIPQLIEYITREEKWTDVNMALWIVGDWLTDVFDRAIIISGDSDFLPAIKKVKRNKSEKIFTSLLLAKTKWKAIRKACDKTCILSEKHIASAVLPDIIKLKNWKTVTKPSTWSKQYSLS